MIIVADRQDGLIAVFKGDKEQLEKYPSVVPYGEKIAHFNRKYLNHLKTRRIRYFNSKMMEFSDNEIVLCENLDDVEVILPIGSEVCYIDKIIPE